MESQNILQLIQVAILSNEVTLFFSVIIGAVFLLAISCLLTNKGNRFALCHEAPTIMTSVGVLGTFVGIFLGLMDFNVNRIDQSVPVLLAGLKVAFVTSILGMVASITFKLLQGLISRGTETGEVGAEEIHSVLQEIRDDGKEAFSQVRQAISGDGDGSVVTQMQKLRTSMGDAHQELCGSVNSGFEELGQQFSKFAETMAENNSKALIEALESVIQDFNTQLNEQFGENFKQLNQAVGALLDWQKEYKEQVIEMNNQFQRSLSGIESAQSAIEEIAAGTASIPTTMDGLADLMRNINVQIEDLERHLQAFANLKDKASEAFPVIEEKLEACTSGLSNTTSSFIESLEQGLAVQSRTFTELEAGFSNLGNETKEVAHKLSGAVDETVKSLSGQLEGILDKQSNAMQSVIDQIHEGFRGAIEESNGVLGKQIAELDQQMQNEVKRVVELMGGHLGSLSAKFVEDYEPLTKRLREVVKIAEAA
jgi:chromosome segregation ATPase